MRHLDETGVYVHLIADGGIRTGGGNAPGGACGAGARVGVGLGRPTVRVQRISAAHADEPTFRAPGGHVRGSLTLARLMGRTQARN